MNWLISFDKLEFFLMKFFENISIICGFFSLDSIISGVMSDISISDRAIIFFGSLILFITIGEDLGSPTL